MPLKTDRSVDTTMPDDTSADVEPDAGDTEATAQTGDLIAPPVDGDDGDDGERAANSQADDTETATATAKSQRDWSRILAFIVLPVVALALAVVAGFLKWEDGSVRESQLARMQSVQAAKDTTVALLSYQPDTAEKELGAAAQLLTGSFKNDFQDLIDKVVIPGSKQQRISTTATVPAAASVSATADHAVVLLYVNQSTTVGGNPPTDLQSTVRVTMEKIDGRWFISEFTPE